MKAILLSVKEAEFIKVLLTMRSVMTECARSSEGAELYHEVLAKINDAGTRP